MPYELPAISQDLAQQLGCDGVQALWTYREEVNQPVMESEHWRRLLPGLVSVALMRSVVAYEKGRADVMEELERELEQAREDKTQALWLSPSGR